MARGSRKFSPQWLRSDSPPTYVQFGFLEALKHQGIWRASPETVNISKRNPLRLNALLTIVAVGVFTIIVYGQPPATTAQRDFAGGAPVTLGSSDIRAIRVRWEAGARSHWHSHAGWQILATEEGRGRTQERGGPIVEMVPGGRPVFTRPGVVHWHGADPDEYAVQLIFMQGGSDGATRFEAVTDSDYQGK